MHIKQFILGIIITMHIKRIDTYLKVLSQHECTYSFFFQLLDLVFYSNHIEERQYSM